MGQNVTNEKSSSPREVYGAKGTVYRWNSLEGLKDGSISGSYHGAGISQSGWGRN